MLVLMINSNSHGWDGREGLRAPGGGPVLGGGLQEPGRVSLTIGPCAERSACVGPPGPPGGPVEGITAVVLKVTCLRSCSW